MKKLKPKYLTNNSYILILCTFLVCQENTLFSQDSRNLDSISQIVIESAYRESPEIDDSIDSTKINRRASFSGFPYAYYTPETKLAIGAGGVFIFYTGKEEKLNPSKIGFGGFYSTNNQYKIGLNNTFYFFNNKLYINWPINFGFYINKYFGIGDASQNYDQAQYSVNNFSTSVTVQLPPQWLISDRAGIIFDYDFTQIEDKMGNELLMSDTTINGDELYGTDGATLMGFGTDILWDSRDNIFFPNKGGYQYFKLIVYPGISDYVFATYQFDLKHFHAFSPDHVLAANVYIEGAVGETPFYKLPQLGGQKRMRGYFYGRYRDNFYMMMQMEYRQYIWWRLGFVVFGGLGNVADEMLSYNWNTLKYSYGAGLRLLFNKKQKVNLRMDIGFGNDGNHGIYFGIEEAF